MCSHDIGRIRIARQQHHGGRKKIARQPQASSQTTAGFAHTRKKQKTGERPTNIDNNSTTTKTCITDTKFMDEIFDRLGNDYAKARDMRIVDVDYRFQRGDVLVHLTHRHEPSVICREKEGKEKEGEDWWERDVNVVYTSDRIVIVDKPASLPVSKCIHARLYRFPTLSHSTQTEVHACYSPSRTFYTQHIHT